MAKYTNVGTESITVRGITIKPGETKELKGFANDRNLIRYNDHITPKAKAKKKPAEIQTQATAQVEIKEELAKSNQSETKKDDKQNAKS